MKIKLLYFGRPSENLTLSDELVDVPAQVKTAGELLAWLRERGGIWAQELTESRVRCAINQEFSAWEATINVNDEVALFSPISGG